MGGKQKTVIPPAHRRPRRAARRRQRGQVMVMFALVLPVMAGFLGLSMAASIEMDTRASLDEASLNAAVAASSDACMTSSTSYDLFECTAGGVQSMYTAAVNLAPGDEPLDPTLTGLLPTPPFTPGPGCSAHWYPSCTQCPTSNNSAYNALPDTNYCITDEQTIALASANWTVAHVLTDDYPGFTVSPCPAAPPYTQANCTPTNSTTIYYGVRVSAWYFYDTTFSSGSMFSPSEDSSRDAVGFETNPTPCPDYVGTRLNAGDQLYAGSTVQGQLCIDHPAGDGDRSPTSLNPASNGGVSPGLDNPTTLTCPANGSFGRLIEVSTFSQFANPFGGILGFGKIGLHSTVDAYGCSG